MKNNFIYLLICFIIIFSLCGCINNQDNNNSKYPFYEYKYQIIIQTNENNNYSLCTPILIETDSEEISEVMSYLNVKGNANTEIIDTKNGQCLIINGTGNIEIESKGNKNVPYAWLNMYNESYGDDKHYGEYWINYESFSGNKMSIYIYTWVNHVENKYSGQGYCCLINIESLSLGWNQYKGEHTIKNI